MCLQDENWVAAELGSDGSALFTEPMTIDELEGSRSMLQAAFNLAPASLCVRMPTCVLQPPPRARHFTCSLPRFRLIRFRSSMWLPRSMGTRRRWSGF